MSNVNAEIKWQGNDNAWFSTNASTVYPANIQIFHTDGRYKFTDGVTTLGALSFLGGLSYTLTTNTIQKATASDTIGDSSITDDGAKVIINSETNINGSFNAISNDGNSLIVVEDGDVYSQWTNGIISSCQNNDSNESSLNFYNGSVHFTAIISAKEFSNDIFHAVKNMFSSPLHEFDNIVKLTGLTPSQIVETDASNNLVSAAKNTGYNLPLGTTAGTVAEGNHNDFITYRKLHNYQNTDSTITGAAATETVVANLKVTGGVMGSNGKLIFNFSAIKSGTASGFSFKSYVSTVATNIVGQTGAPTAATLVGQMVYGNTVIYGGVFSRSMANKNSASTNYVYPVSVTNAAFDTAATASARTSVNINTANDFYLVITCTMNSAADTGGLADVQIFIDKP